ncbi:MAG: Asp-tRNA(Asn)/Glu-tRNA(Gln) amidotransferase subunit GatC [Gammaproteobacteria bacterium]|nr:Asp-tRNA(Asn)/Glu-tRNA(Gln) amidotransferase subunit GatC [Gammaproteobacteria bacterium]
MSTLDKSDVEKIAFLARLGIDEQDIPEYATNLSNILELVEQLNSVNTDEVKPMAHPLDSVQRLRTDVVTEVNDRENLQSHAPEVEAGLFLVPRVVE